MRLSTGNTIGSLMDLGEKSRRITTESLRIVLSQKVNTPSFVVERAILIGANLTKKQCYILCIGTILYSTIGSLKEKKSKNHKRKFAYCRPTLSKVNTSSFVTENQQ